MAKDEKPKFPKAPDKPYEPNSKYDPKKPIMPRYDTATPEQMIERWVELSSTEQQLGIEKRTRKHRRSIEDSVDEIHTGIESKHKKVAENLDTKEKKEYAAQIITEMASRYARAHKGKDYKVTDHDVEEFIQQSGWRGSYIDLLKYIVNNEGDLRIDDESNNRYLRNMKVTAATASDDVGQEYQRVGQIIATQHQHHGVLQGKLEKLMAGKKRKFSPAASAEEMMQNYMDHLKQEKDGKEGGKTYYQAPPAYKKAA